MLKIKSLSLLLLLSIYAFTQNNTVIKGQITNTKNEVIPFAHVSFEDNGKGVSADESGRFEIKSIKKGKRSIIISAIGYKKFKKEVNVNSTSTIYLEVQLEETSTEIERVEVFGERNKQPEKLAVLTRLPLKPSEQIQSISVISDQLIEKQGNLTISEATRNVPGVYTFATYGNARESMSARGFRGIPIVKNGVRINSDFRGTGVLTDMQGVESIQVLKGAAAITQGVATDLGSPGGIINIVTKTPKFYNGGQASLRIGSWGQVRPTFDVYGAVNESENLAFRINGAFEHLNSYRKSVMNERLYINPSLAWKANEKTTIVFEMDYLDDSRTADPGTINLAPNDSNAIYDLPYDKFLGFEENISVTENATYAVRLNRKLNDKLNFRAALFASTLNVNQNSTSLSSGGGRGAAALPTLSEYNKRYRQIGQSTRQDNNTVLQLDLVGKDLETGKLKHTFQLGMDYRKTHLITASASMNPLSYVDIIDVFAPINNQLPQMGYLYTPAVIKNDSVIEGAKTEQESITLNPSNEVVSDNKSFGVMAQDVIQFNDWIKVFLGLRFSTYESRGSASNGVSYSNAIDPQLGIMLNPYKGLNIFGSYTSSTSLRGADNLDVNGNELGNQRIDQLEVGLKSDWLENRLRFNLTLYKINNRNMSMPVYDNNWIETGYFQKGGNDERKGIEVEILGRPIENVEIVAGYAFIDAQYKEHASFFSGSSPLNTPSHTANAWINYSFSKGKIKGLQFGAGAYYISERPVNDWSKTVTHEGITAGQKPFMIDDYMTVNLQLAYRYEKYAVRLLFNNIFDEIGYNAYRTRFINQTDPRNFAAVISYKF